MKHFLMRTLLLTGAFLFGYYYSFGQIVISEFSYDPPESGTDSLEFVEIVNIGNQPVDISGYKLWFGSTIAERFTYPANTILAPNQVSVIAVNPGALLRNYDMTTLAHQWTGTSGLGNSGSKIVIRNANNSTVDSISYTNSSAPSGTNGNGKTAVLCDLILDNNVMSNWTASTNAILRNGLPHTINGKALYGSPGFLECGLTTEPADQFNDECATATAVTVGQQCTPTAGNLLEATESMAGCVGIGEANDVWYSFVATTNNLLINVTTDEDVVLEIFEGTCGALTSIECVDYNIVNEAYSSSDFILGQTYFVRVYAYDFEDLFTGDFTICVRELVAPANDECVDAIVLTVGEQCTPTAGNLMMATESMEGCAGSGDANDVWYSFVAASNNLQISATTEEDVVMEVFRGTCGAIESIECIDQGISGESYSAADFTVGETYLVRLYAYYPYEVVTGDFTICVQELVAPANDECVDAIVLTAGEQCTPTAGNLMGATQSMEGCAGSGDAKDLWYSFVANSNTLRVNVITEEDVVMEIFNEDCDNLQSIECVDYSYENEIYDGTDFVVGQTYLVRVYAYDSEYLNTGDFTICVQEFTPVENNSCLSATSLTSSTTCSPVLGTLANATMSLMEEACYEYENRDVWYSFVAQANNATIYVQGLDYMDVIVDVYNGTCGQLTYLTCQDTGSDEEVELTNLTVGNTYFVRVSDYNGGFEQSTEFSICVTHVAPANPCEDVTITGTVTGCGPDAEVVADGGTPTYTYEWSNSLTTATVSNLVVGETYTVTITDAIGCAGTVTYVPIACPVVDPCIDVTITGTVTGCGPDAEVVADGGTPTYTYEWSNAVTTATVSNLVVGETYTVTITDANGCAGTVTYVPIACPVVDPCVDVTITGTVTGCDGELAVEPAGGTSPYTYLWSNGETTQQALVSDTEEEQFVTITDANGCTTTVEFEWMPCIAVTKIDGGAGLNVYPNPTSGQVTLEINTLSAEQLSIQLINATGQVVMSMEVFNNGQQAHSLSLADVATGMYIISIKGKEYVKTERLNVIR